MRRALLPLVLLLSLAACAPRGVLLPSVVAVPDEQIEPVYVGTTRGFGDGLALSTRPGQLLFARYGINVPGDREPGKIRWPLRGETQSVAKHFLLAEFESYANGTQLRAGLNAELRSRPVAERQLVVYVHGYNTTYAEGIFRIAQIRRDFDVPGVAVHYAWPSAGHPLGYAFDRDSALYARDGLENFLIELSRTEAREIVLVAHSVGAYLAMEVLRQLRLTGNTAVLDRLGGVILLSPDLDLDVFRAQAERIGELPQPFLILSSRRDRVLAVSARITGQPERLGTISSVETLADLNVTLIDLSQVNGGDTFNHATAVTSPVVIRMLTEAVGIGRAFDQSGAARPGLIPGTVLTVRNATQIILAPGAP